MTLGECLDQLSKYYLCEESEMKTKLGMTIIKKLKSIYYTRSYPKNDWRLLHRRGENPILCHKNIQVEVPIDKMMEDEMRRGELPSMTRSEIEDSRKYLSKKISIDKPFTVYKKNTFNIIQ